jgi:hypothetical protein
VVIVTIGLIVLCLGGCWLDSHYRLEAIKAGQALRPHGPFLEDQWEAEKEAKPNAR